MNLESKDLKEHLKGKTHWKDLKTEKDLSPTTPAHGTEVLRTQIS